MAIETVQVVIDSLLAAGVKYVFGIPGAKIDSLFDALLDHPDIKLVVCRHEQNAAFIAAAVGRMTGRPGVCIATSGPGTSNLVTGLVTANDEGNPVVAIVGSTKRSQALRKTHQSLRAQELLAPVTKHVDTALVEDQVPEVLVTAFRAASTQPRGAAAVILPVDIMTKSTSKSSVPSFPASAFTPPEYGPSPSSQITTAAKLIENAKAPMLFLGMRSSQPEVVAAVRQFLQKHPMPVVETFQAAGAINTDLLHLFYGRLGLFHNQPGDELIGAADLIVTIGFEESEYETSLWNSEHRDIIHIDSAMAQCGYWYIPRQELIGGIAENISRLTEEVKTNAKFQETSAGQAIISKSRAWQTSEKATGEAQGTGPVHPLHFIRVLQDLLPPSTTVTSDIGSVYIWLSRYFYVHEPNTLLTSNAQQTLGVGLPWAIGVSLSQSPQPCSKKVVSISGDGGFQFSCQELATAVLQKCNITHFIWNDEKYNMVEFQEVAKYGRASGIDLGGVDFVKLAGAYGAKGLRVSKSSELESVMKEALVYEGVCIVDIAIDYTDNLELMQQVQSDKIA